MRILIISIFLSISAFSQTRYVINGLNNFDEHGNILPEIISFVTNGESMDEIMIEPCGDENCIPTRARSISILGDVNVDISCSFSARGESCEIDLGSFECSGIERNINEGYESMNSTVEAAYSELIVNEVLGYGNGHTKASLCNNISQSTVPWDNVPTPRINPRRGSSTN